MPTEIKITSGDYVEKALRKFKRLVEKSGVIAEIKRRRSYEKPSEKRKRKLEESEKKRKKKIRKYSKYESKI